MMKLMYITSDPRIARYAQRAGVDWIFVDLETLGKESRQGHLDTVISRHTIADIASVKSALTKSRLIVRVNPINGGSPAEIEKVISAGADIVMLPYFNTEQEVAQFITMVGGRVETCLLVETPRAADNIATLVDRSGIDYVHIGLNDLHLGYGQRFMFEPLVDGTLDRISSVLREAGVEFGFGGIARLGCGELPAERVLAEHRRLGSNMVILSRSFLGRVEPQIDLEALFMKEVEQIRKHESFLKEQEPDFFEANRVATVGAVKAIVGKLQR